MRVQLIKEGSTADDAVALVLEVAKAHVQSASITALLQVEPFTPADVVGWLGRMFALIDRLTTYKYDDPGREQIKTPDLFLHQGYGDCDDYSTLWLTLLNRVGVKGYAKIVDYEDDANWDHIYVVAVHEGREIVLDSVHGKFGGKFGLEVNYQKSKTFQ